MLHAIAVDIGGSGGKMALAGFDGQKVETVKDWPFRNSPVDIGGSMLVNVLGLFDSIKNGVRLLSRPDVRSIGIDTWGGSYAYLGPNGLPANSVFNCRDPRTIEAYEELNSKIDGYQVFAKSGVPNSRFSVLTQMYKDVMDGVLRDGDGKSFLLLANLFPHLLGAARVNDVSTALETCLTDLAGREWNLELLDALGIPRSVVNPIAQVGTRNGRLRACYRTELRCPDVEIVNVAGHDTMNALASIPGLTERDCFVSIGTTIVVGAKTTAPVLTREAYRLRYKNTRGAFDQNYVCTDVTGFWVLNECRKQLAVEDREYSYDELHAAAVEAAENDSYIDLTDERFKKTNPRMMSAIGDYCRSTGQSIPSTVGEVVRCVFESYAVQIKTTLDNLKIVTNNDCFNRVFVISGGTRNTLLMQMIADALGRPVLAGIPNATLMGNAIIQLSAIGCASGPEQMASIAENSCCLRLYEDRENGRWKDKIERAIMRYLVAGEDG